MNVTVGLGRLYAISDTHTHTHPDSSSFTEMVRLLTTGKLEMIDAQTSDYCSKH